GGWGRRGAAGVAAAARGGLGGWLTAIEVGKGQDAYARHGLRPMPWTFLQYSAQVAGYRAAIARAAPGIPLAGPGVSGSSVFRRWGRGEVRRFRPALLTGHHYPLRCQQLSAFPRGQLLSPSIRSLEGVSLQRYTSVSRATGIGFRLDETNSVSCGGRAGVSDTFASTLWAVDYIARTMAAGVVGVNLHGNPANCRGYTPVCGSTAGRLTAG